MVADVKCVFCNSKGDSKEHIVPRWLQKQYQLETQSFIVWNGTSLQYNQAVIQACKSCNGIIFSRIEQRIHDDTATDRDYFLWALKISYALGIKDTRIALDRKQPHKGSLLHHNDVNDHEDLIMHIFSNIENEAFHYSPDPFGSVFIFDNPHNDNDFGFADIQKPFRGLTISFNRKILGVLFNDRGQVKKEIERIYKQKGGLKTFFKSCICSSTTETARLLMLQLLIWQYKIRNIPSEYTMTENTLKSQRIPKANYRKKVERVVIETLARRLRIPNEVAMLFYDSLPDHNKG